MHRWPRGRWAAVAVLAVVAALLPPSAFPASAGTPSAAAAPAVIPALSQWTPGAGSLPLTARSRVVATAASLSDEVTTFTSDVTAETGLRLDDAPDGGAAEPGDVVLRLDPSRTDLGTEGYELVVSETAQITAATDTGAFHGTRTVLQLLSASTDLPRGRAVDVPEYAERGVGVCACYIHVSMPWFQRLMRDMAYLKLNQLWIEAKVASDAYPDTAFWGYYTKDEVRQLSAMAAQYHITLVPEINSPGHIDPYLKNHPELQLTDASGARSPSRLDITQPAAFDFYTRLVDEALQVWNTPYWHMGADEYMLGSAYPAYPQITAYAKAKYGSAATPQDAFIDFVNRVDDHVRAQGRTLRIWNDGLTGDNTVPLNRDIDVEHWLTETDQPPSTLLAQGHRVQNSAYSLYLVRGGFHMDTQGLYDSDWTPLRFEGETLTGPQPGITGAKISMWPDSAAAETENEVEAEAFMPLRFIAQATWGSPKPAETYAEFTTLAQQLGHAPDWNNAVRLPLPNGTYALTVPGSTTRLTTGGSTAGAAAHLATDSTVTWAMTSTSDGYHQLRAVREGIQTRYCLDVVDGVRYLGAPLEAGAPLTQQTCASGTRTQRWQLLPGDGGTVRLVNAISQLGLAATTTGAAVQQPPDIHSPVGLRPVRTG